MDYIKCLQLSLDYIENNLDAEISMQECADESGYSKFHYCRLFQMTIGVSVMEYIRMRRLSRIAIEISNNDKKINEIYNKWGFNSHENFIRAFKKMFAITPNAYRKAKSSLNLFHNIDLSKMHIPQHDDNFYVEPKFIIKPAFSVF